MEPGGRRKIAMLLTTMDMQTATELLKGQPAEVVKQIALELSEMEATGRHNPYRAMEITREFCDTIRRSQSNEMDIPRLVDNLLKNSVGGERNLQLKAGVKEAIRRKDPFFVISSAGPGQILAVLEDESPQTIAIVLSSLPVKLGTQVLAGLDEQTSAQTVWKMAQVNNISHRTVQRIGEMVCRKLDELSTKAAPVEQSGGQSSLRKVAVMLNGLDKERKTNLLKQIGSNSEEVSNNIKALMVTWEDIPRIENKPLQEILRKIDSEILAKALVNADAVVASKIRSNISERASQMIDEETSLMSEPRRDDILAAREEIAKLLRQANEADGLAFIEEG